MAEREIMFSSNVKYAGIFSLENFYRFCYDWLTEETELLLSERKYSEKLKGELKEVDIEWIGKRKVTDYFMFEVKVVFRILELVKVEIMQDNVKIKTNKGRIEIKVTGTLVRDYDGKFEATAFKKFLRSVYEKWIIRSRIDQFEEKLITDCDEFLNQSKAYLDLEGKR